MLKVVLCYNVKKNTIEFFVVVVVVNTTIGS